MGMQLSPLVMGRFGQKMGQHKRYGENVTLAMQKQLNHMPFDGECDGTKELDGVHIGATWQIRLNDYAWQLLVGLPPGIST